MHQRRSGRRYFSLAVLVLVLCSTVIQTQTLEAASSSLGVVSTEERHLKFFPADIIARAKTWVDAQPPVPYSKLPPYYPDPVHGYRKDCSGYVSMAWGLSSPGLTTYTLPSVSHLINKNDLMPGDVLLNQDPEYNRNNLSDTDWAHVVIFAGWTDANGNHVDHVSDYYDAYEENGYYGHAREETKMPYPYYYGDYHNVQDYVPMRLDLLNTNKLTPSPTTSPILPGGLWIIPPSPKNEDTLHDTIHFAAQAYPTHQSDPAIAFVNFTIGSQGSWQVGCVAAPPETGNTFACNVNLKNLGISYGQIQVSFDVYDQAGNVNLSPNGVHTLNYAPTFLYSADWSNGLNGWTGTSQWSAVNGVLHSDGMDLGYPNTILSPFHPATANYAIEARIQIVTLTDDCYVGIRGRAPENGRFDGYFAGYRSKDADIELIDYGFSPNSAFKELNNQYSYRPGLVWHTYRVEFKGNQITLKIDGILLVQATDNNSLAPGLVGLASGGLALSTIATKNKHCRDSPYASA